MEDNNLRPKTLAAHVSASTYRLMRLMSSLHGTNISTYVAMVLEEHISATLTEEHRTTFLEMKLGKD